jgi:hypothetical protein
MEASLWQLAGTWERLRNNQEFDINKFDIARFDCIRMMHAALVHRYANSTIKFMTITEQTLKITKINQL